MCSVSIPRLFLSGQIRSIKREYPAQAASDYLLCHRPQQHTGQALSFPISDNHKVVVTAEVHEHALGIAPTKHHLAPNAYG